MVTSVVHFPPPGSFLHIFRALGSVFPLLVDFQRLLPTNLLAPSWGWKFTPELEQLWIDRKWSLDRYIAAMNNCIRNALCLIFREQISYKDIAEAGPTYYSTASPRLIFFPIFSFLSPFCLWHPTLFVFLFLQLPGQQRGSQTDLKHTAQSGPRFGAAARSQNRFKSPPKLAPA